jgi:hypothetical protein
MGYTVCMRLFPYPGLYRVYIWLYCVYLRLFPFPGLYRVYTRLFPFPGLYRVYMWLYCVYIRLFPYPGLYRVHMRQYFPIRDYTVSTSDNISLSGAIPQLHVTIPCPGLHRVYMRLYPGLHRVYMRQYFPIRGYSVSTWDNISLSGAIHNTSLSGDLCCYACLSVTIFPCPGPGATCVWCRFSMLQYFPVRGQVLPVLDNISLSGAIHNTSLSGDLCCYAASQCYNISLSGAGYLLCCMPRPKVTILPCLGPNCVVCRVSIVTLFPCPWPGTTRVLRHDSM